jgi:hypothetical protein
MGSPSAAIGETGFWVLQFLLDGSGLAVVNWRDAAAVA